MSWLLALLVFFAQPADNPSALVSRQWMQYSTWLTNRDTESLANLYTPDARVMESGFDDIVGRAAIRKVLTDILAQRVRPVDLRVMPRETAGYDGVIYDLGDYVQTLAPQGNPRGAYDVYGRYFAVWVQQADTTWKIARIMRAPKKPSAPR
jgi:ketosteroid isomerase-like protein